MDYDLWKDNIPTLEEAIEEYKTMQPGVWRNTYWYITVKVEGVT